MTNKEKMQKEIVLDVLKHLKTMLDGTTNMIARLTLASTIVWTEEKYRVKLED